MGGHLLLPTPGLLGGRALLPGLEGGGVTEGQSLHPGSPVGCRGREGQEGTVGSVGKDPLHFQPATVVQNPQLSWEALKKLLGRSCSLNGEISADAFLL